MIRMMPWSGNTTPDAEHQKGWATRLPRRGLGRPTAAGTAPSPVARPVFRRQLKHGHRDRDPLDLRRSPPLLHALGDRGDHDQGGSCGGRGRHPVPGSRQGCPADAAGQPM